MPRPDLMIEQGGDAVPGGYNGYFVAYDAMTGDKAGYLDYQSPPGQPVLIAMVEVSPAWRRQGIGAELLRALRWDFPDSPIEAGYTTSDGAAWWSTQRRGGDD